MSSRVFLVNPSNTRAIFQAVCKIIDAKKSNNTTVLVSSFSEVNQLKTFIASNYPNSAFGTKVCTLREYVIEAWELFGDGKDIATSAFTRALLMKILEDKSKLGTTTLRPTAKTVKMLAQAISIGFGLNDFEEILTQADMWDQAEEDQSEIWEILYIFSKALEEYNMTTLSRSMSYLVDTLPTKGDVICAGYKTFTPPEIHFLGKIDADVIFGRGENDAAYACIDKLVHSISSSAKIQQLDIGLDIDEGYKDQQSSEIASLTKTIFSGQNPIKPTGDIRFGLPLGIYAESLLIADIVESLIEQGIEPSKIFIVKTGIERQEDLIERLYSKGIAVEGRFEAKFNQTAFGRAFLQFVNASKIFEISDFCNSRFSGIRYSDYLIISKKWRQRRDITLDEILDDIQKCSKAASDIVDARHNEDYLSIAAAMISAFGVWTDPNNLESKLAIAAKNKVEEIFENAKTLGISVDSALSLLEEEYVSCAFVTSPSFVVSPSLEGKDTDGAVGDGLSSDTMGDGLSNDTQRKAGLTDATNSAGESRSAVKIGTLAEASQRTYDVLLACGLTTEAFSSEEKLDPIASVFKQANIVETVSQIELLRHDFCRALDSTNKAVIVSRVLNDEKGEELRPSVLYEELVDSYREDLSDFTNIDKTSALPKELVSGISTKKLGIFGTDLVIKVSEDELCKIAHAHRYPQDVKPHAELTYKKLGSGLTEITAHELIKIAKKSNDIRVFSPTEVEIYFNCPYRWYIERVCSPQSLDVTLTPADIGTLIHSVISEYYSNKAKKLSKATRIEPREFSSLDTEIPKLIDRYIQALASSNETSPFRNLSLLERRKIDEAQRKIIDLLKDDYKFLPDFVPSIFEHSFGREQQFVYAGRPFVGTIDRVDLDRSNNAIIIDYKGGNLDKGYGPAKTETDGSDVLSILSSDGISHIQILIYATAIARQLGLNVVGLLYRSYGKRRVAAGLMVEDFTNTAESFTKQQHIVNRQTFDEVMDRAEEKISKVLDKMEQGDISPDPFAQHSCLFCPVSNCVRRLS